MRLSRTSTLGLSALLAGSLASGALAAEASYDCTAVAATDLAGIAACLAAAGADGTCTLSGTCEVTTAIVTHGVIMGLPNQTLQGPATIHGPGSLIRLFEGASGSTIKNLTLISDGGVAIRNWSPLVPAFFLQPDDITIQNVTMRGPRCVEQWSTNFGTAEDTNRATGAAGAISDGWTIDHSSCTVTANGVTGILLTGNANRITYSEVHVIDQPVAAARNAINLQNNYKTGLAGAPLPGGADNFVYGNYINMTQQVAGFPRGIFQFGLQVPPTSPEVPGDRARNNHIEKNCIFIDAGPGARGIAIQPQRTELDTIIKNNITFHIDDPDNSNRGINTIGTFRSTLADNDIAGGGDVAIGTFDVTSQGNLILANDFSLGSDDIVPPQFVMYNQGGVAANPNVYRLNKWCTGVIALEVGSVALDGGNNMAGHFCSHAAGELPSAHDCARGLGFAGPKSLGQPADAPEEIALGSDTYEGDIVEMFPVGDPAPLATVPVMGRRPLTEGGAVLRRTR